MTRHASTAVVTTLAVLVSACASGPTYVAPTPSVTAGESFIGANNPLYASTPLTGDWWRLFNDPLLDGYIKDALAANTDLRVAEGNLRRSRALLNESRSARLPSTTLRAQTTDASSAPRAAAVAADSEPNAYEAWANINYQLDLFGGIRRGIEASRADAEAERAAYDLVRITVVADVARAYADVCALGLQLQAVDRGATAQAESARITQLRYENGDVSGLDAAQARAELERTRSAKPSLAAERNAALFRLAVLTGKPPAAFPRTAEVCVSPPALSAPLPVGDVGAMLRRRPDIRRAERSLAAATARIGVAIADLYPKVSIGIAGGVTAKTNADAVFRLQTTPLITWSFPNITATRTRIAQARAGADIALAAWDGAVLNALREAETALAQYAGEVERNRMLKELRAQSAIAADRARLRRDEGMDSPLALLLAEQRLAEAEALVAASDRHLATAQIALFLALGGGWRN